MTNKRVKLPKKVKIGSREYKVIKRSKRWGKKHKAYGQIQYDKRIIELSNDQNSKELADTLLHELIHSIIHEYKIKLDGRKEESLVTKISNGFTDVFSKNPNLLPWLVRQLEQTT